MPTEQPALRAPWDGPREITQGNHGTYSHTVCRQQETDPSKYRQLDPDDCNWENTYAIDVKGINFPVLAPGNGHISHVDEDLVPADSSAGITLGMIVEGMTDVEIMFLHLSEIRVKEGPLRQGQVIAISGSSGYGMNEGGVFPHLHFHLCPLNSHSVNDTIPISKLYMSREGESDYKYYQSNDAGGELSLEHSNIGGDTFESINTDEYCVRFTGEETFPDGTEIGRGLEFKKTWWFRNCGSKRIDDLSNLKVVQISGLRNEEYFPSSIDFRPENAREPGDPFDLSIDMTAPEAIGRYKVEYQFKEVKEVNGNIEEVEISAPFWVEIIVIHCYEEVRDRHWKGEYFDNPNLQPNEAGEPVMVRDEGDGALDFDWNDESPVDRKKEACVPGHNFGVPADNFSARWTSQINFDVDKYSFTVVSDKHVILKIIKKSHNPEIPDQIVELLDELPDPETRPILVKRIDVEVTTASSEIDFNRDLRKLTMPPGEYTIEMEYFGTGGGKVAKFFSQNQADCTGTNVSETNWKGEYFDDTELNGRLLMVKDHGSGFLNFDDWGPYGPGIECGVDLDNFSARWTRKVHFNQDIYRFAVTGDRTITLTVDDTLVLHISNPQTAAWADHEITEQGNHTLILEYYGPIVAENAVVAPEPSWRLRSECIDETISEYRWKGEYFNNPDLDEHGEESVMVRDDGEDLNFRSDGSPDSACGVNADNFSVRWTRKANFPATTDYQFIVIANDGVLLYIADEGVPIQPILNKWSERGETTTYVSKVRLEAGEHRLVMKYVNTSGSAAARLFWQYASACIDPDLDVSKDNPEYYPVDYWRGEYYNNPALDLNGEEAVMVRKDYGKYSLPYLNFVDWGEGSPSSRCFVHANNYSVRWTRSIHIWSPGTYRFVATTDDGVRLYIDNMEVPRIEDWQEQEEPTRHEVDVVLGQALHKIKMEYYKVSDNAFAELEWNSLPLANVVLVIDRSGSMAEGTRIQDAKAAARLFVDLMQLGDRIGIVPFSCHVPQTEQCEELSPVFRLRVIGLEGTDSTTRSDAQSFIDELIAEGSTSIGAGLLKGLDLLREITDPIRIMVLLSDGEENRDPRVTDELLDQIRGENIKVITVGFGTNANDPDLDLLETIADQPDHYLFAPSGNELQAIFSTLLGRVYGADVLQTAAGTVASGGTAEQRILVDSTIGSATFSLFWRGSELDLTLVQPDGNIIDPSSVETNPNISFTSGGTYQFYKIYNPQAGEWTMRIFGKSTPAEGEAYSISVSAMSSMKASIKFDKDQYFAGDPVQIEARIEDTFIDFAEPNYVRGAVIKVNVEDPYLTQYSFDLYDDGLHGDGEANDGVYANTFANTPFIGNYNFRVQISGANNRDGQPFTREYAFSHVLTDPTLRFPNTPVLDNFNRKNGALVRSWSGAKSGYRIAGQQAHVRKGGPIYWKPGILAADQQAFVTLAHVDPAGLEQGLLIKVQGKANNPQSWRRGAISVFYNAREGKIGIKTYVPRQEWKMLGMFDAKLQDGDQLGGRAEADGKVRAYLNGVEIGSVDAGSFFAGKGGYIGMWFSDAEDAVVDDFGGGGAIAVPVIQGTDDAGLHPDDCRYWTNQNEIYFGRCMDGSPIVSGFRFQNVPLPPRATIVEAHLDFTVDGPFANEIALQFLGERSANPETFSDTDRPSERQMTAAMVPWAISATNVWNFNVRRRTPAVTGIVQELVNLPDWESGNAMAFIVQPDLDVPGDVSRRVYAWERELSAAARLVVIYTIEALAGGDDHDDDNHDHDDDNDDNDDNDRKKSSKARA